MHIYYEYIYNNNLSLMIAPSMKHSVGEISLALCKPLISKIKVILYI